MTTNTYQRSASFYLKLLNDPNESEAMKSIATDALLRMAINADKTMEGWKKSNERQLERIGIKLMD